MLKESIIFVMLILFSIEDIRKRFSGTIGKVLSHSENFFGSSKHIRIGGGS